MIAPSNQIYKSSALWQLSKLPRVSNHYLTPNDDTYTVPTTNALLGNYVYAGEGNDRIIGSDVHDSIFGGGNDDKLFGNGANDELHGEDGDDELDGGGGADWMVGGTGWDHYFVDNSGDVVVEDPSATDTDTVFTWVTYTVPDNVEVMLLQGMDAIDATGNMQNNWISGNDAKNVISGGDGMDRLFGLGGDDTLIGGAHDDTLYGGLGNDKLIGGPGHDKMRGEAGADTFIFASVADCGLVTADADEVYDFYSLQGDRIDVSGIDANATLAGDQAFNFIGNANFSNTAGELRFASFFLEGDLDGNGAGDFFIAVNSAALMHSDFIL
jgi:Ca2+-binding RTX toxin-like protein